MRKTILAGVLALMSTGATATEIFGNHAERVSFVEVSAVNYEFTSESEGKEVKENQVGAKLKYQRIDSLNFGYELSHQGFAYEEDGTELTMQLSKIGFMYKQDLFTPRAYIMPEIGGYYLQSDVDKGLASDLIGSDYSFEENEGNYYAKVTLGGSLVENKVDLKAYYTHYEHKNDLLDNGAVGAQINYHFNRDFHLILNAEKFNDVMTYGVGISVNYF